MEDEKIVNYIVIGQMLGISLGSCFGTILYVITNNVLCISSGLCTGLAVGVSLSIAIFYLKNNKRKEN